MPDQQTWTVVGAGLAGTLTCLELIRRDQSVRWIMNPSRPPASTVAAGMYNPITGKRFAKTWQVDVLQPFMEDYYREIEEDIRTQVLFPKPVMKLFTDPDEQGRWDARKDDEDFQRLARPIEPGECPSGIRDPRLGGFVVPGAGSVHVSTLLQAVQKFLAPRLEIVEGNFTDISQDEGPVIHCIGWRAIEDPRFHAIPFRHAHGDVLTIHAPDLGESHVLNTGLYILPLGQHLFRAGATYDWNRLDPTPTEEGRQELESQLQQILTVPYMVTDHFAGIRPATRRRTPVLGRLPDDPAHILFNGLGSKGVLLAPYYARHLVTHLLDGTPLDRDVDIHTHIASGLRGAAR